MLTVGIIIFLKLLVNYLFYALFSMSDKHARFAGDRYFSVQHGLLLKIGTFCLIISMILLIEGNLLVLELISIGNIEVSLAIIGVFLAILGWVNRGGVGANERQGYVAFLLQAGLSLIIFSIVLLSYRWAIDMHRKEIDSVTYYLISVWFLLSLGLARADINYVSMHRFYRNRLLEAFLEPPEPDPAGNQTGVKSEPGNLNLNRIQIKDTGAPYHLINTNLVTVGSNEHKLWLRGGENFIFSPKFIGSEKTGWVGTNNKKFKKIDLATAFAISGAALDPNTGETRSWPLQVIMTWLNVRLGYWCENPRKIKPTVRFGYGCENPRKIKPTDESTLANKLWNLTCSSWLFLIISEMFRSPKEDLDFIRLSDGGHFENLGLYELIRRRCSLIIVSDASADPGYTFSDLAKAIERIRVDFNVEIEDLCTDKIQPKSPYLNSHIEKDQQPNNQLDISTLPYATGTIKYPNSEKTGLLIYLKTTLFPGLSEDILGYARRHKSFPDESTSDQFFTEEQFEAYRELGFQAMNKVFEENGKEKDMRDYMLKYPFFSKPPQTK